MYHSSNAEFYMQLSTHVYQISHFSDSRILYSKNDSNIVAETHTDFIQGIKTFQKFFSIKLALPFFNIFITPDRKEYDRFVSHLTKTPTHKGRVAQPQVLDLYLLSPNAYQKDASAFFAGKNGKYDKDIYRRVVIHETVHMLEEFLAPKGHMEYPALGWSTEGLAVYISQQHLREDDIWELLKKDLHTNSVPSLKNCNGTNSYTWGWTIISFIEKKYGRDSILSYIQSPCHTDLVSLLGTNTSAFEAEWQEFAKLEAKKLLDKVPL
jgi:hypothetical protein